MTKLKNSNGGKSQKLKVSQLELLQISIYEEENNFKKGLLVRTFGHLGNR